MHSYSDFHKRITLTGSLIAVGIVFGDIGTSPLYTLNAVFHSRAVTKEVASGAFSAIFWKLVFQTTIKDSITYVLADKEKTSWILTNFMFNAIRYS